MKSKNKGITLIALVITIIVLLILAGISIASLIGDNGILTKAQTAKEKTEIATEDEQRKTAMLEAATNTENTKFQGITIPAGFAPTRISGESTVDEGLVIIDADGNEFVWVPVDVNKFQIAEGYWNGEKGAMVSKCKEPLEDGYSTEKDEYEKMVSSVTKNGGFYIGRYEAGNEGGELKQDNVDASKYYWDGEKVVVKKDATVYNYIGWSNSDDMKNEKGGAVEKAKGFKVGKAYENSVTSTLIYGIQWDATMQFFDSRYIEGISEENIKSSYVSDSTGKGNYNEEANKNDWKGKIAKTGSSPEYAVKNIYDMAGNVREWTMEACNTNARISRGGDYGNSGFRIPVSNRNDFKASYSVDWIGFRIALYIGV